MTSLLAAGLGTFPLFFSCQVFGTGAPIGSGYPLFPTHSQQSYNGLGYNNYQSPMAPGSQAQHDPRVTRDPAWYLPLDIDFSGPESNGYHNVILPNLPGK